MSRTNITIFAEFKSGNFEKGAARLSRKLKETSTDLKRIGNTMSMSISAPIVAGLGIALKEFATFEHAMAKVKAVIGDKANSDQLGQLSELSLALGRSTMYTAQQVASLESNYAKLGFSADEILKVTEATLELAQATDSDLAESAMVAGATLRGFGLDASEMTRVVDVMAKSFTSSALDLEKFKVSISKIAPIAAVTGRSLEEVAAQESVLADTGIEASIIGTSLRKIYGDLAKSGMSYDDAMKQIANSTNKVATATKLFDIRAANAAIILSEQSNKVKFLTEQYNGAGGAAKDMADIMNKSLFVQFKKLQSAITDLAIAVGERLNPHIRDLTDTLIEWANKFSELSPRTQDLIIKIGLLVASLGPLALGIAAVTAALSIMTGSTIILGFVALAGAVALFTAAQKQNYKLNEKNKSTLDRLNIVNGTLESGLERINNLKRINKKLTEEQIKSEILLARTYVVTGVAELKKAAATFKAVKVQRDKAKAEYDAILEKQKGQVRTEAWESGMAASEREAAKIKLGNFQHQLDALKPSFKSNIENVKALKAVYKDLDAVLRGLGRTVSTVDTPSPLAIDDKGIIGKGLKKQGLSSEEWIKVLDGETLLETAKKIVKKEVDKMGLIIPLDLDLDTSAIGDRIAQFQNDLKAGFEDFATDIAMFLADSLGKAIAGAFEGKDFGKGALEVIAGFMQQMGALMIAYAMQMALFNASVKDPSKWPIALAAGVAMVAIGAAIKAAANKGLDGGGGGVASPSYSGSGVNYGSRDFSNEVRIEGREMVITQRREGSFRR